jgi:hypothetical protein
MIFPGPQPKHNACRKDKPCPAHSEIAIIAARAEFFRLNPAGLLQEKDRKIGGSLQKRSGFPAKEKHQAFSVCKTFVFILIDPMLS